MIVPELTNIFSLITANCNF